MDGNIRTIKASDYFSGWREDLIARLMVDDEETIVEELRSPLYVDPPEDAEIVGLEEFVATLAEEARERERES